MAKLGWYVAGPRIGEIKEQLRNFARDIYKGKTSYKLGDPGCRDSIERTELISEVLDSIEDSDRGLHSSEFVGFQDVCLLDMWVDLGYLKFYPDNKDIGFRDVVKIF